MTGSIYSAPGIIPSLGVDTKATLFSQYLKLFPLRLNSSVKKVDTAAWRSVSKFHYLSDEEILASIDSQPAFLRACTFDDKTSIAALGIPASSRYNDVAQYRRLITVLSDFGLKPKTYKAAGSDDLQIYLPFLEETASAPLTRAMSRMLMHQGFELSPQTLIVYPSLEPFVFPLQAGFVWLNDHLQPKLKRDDISVESAMALFLSDISRSAVAYETFLQRLDEVFPVRHIQLPKLEIAGIEAAQPQAEAITALPEDAEPLVQFEMPLSQAVMPLSQAVMPLSQAGELPFDPLVEKLLFQPPADPDKQLLLFPNGGTRTPNPNATARADRKRGRRTRGRSENLPENSEDS